MSDSYSDIGLRATEWRMRAGLSSAPTIVLCKLTEEVGEVAKALIGEWESREGRGDPVQEAAQVIIVLASLIHITHPEADLFAAVWDEMERLGA